MRLGGRSRWAALAGLVLAVAAVAAAAGEPPRAEDGLPRLGGPPAADPAKFTFAILGDRTAGGEGNWPVFDRAVDEINRLRPDFAVMIGDLIPGYNNGALDAEWKVFREHASRLAVPLFLVPGNHDIFNSEARAYWIRNVGRTFYSFDHKGCHFVVLNTEEAHNGNGSGLAEAQVLWAVEDIRKSDARQIFVLLHKPFFLPGQDPGAPWDEWGRVRAALKGRRYTVFGGHEHCLQRQVLDGRRHFVLGPTGGECHVQADKALGLFHHFTMVTVEGEEAHIAFIEPGSIHPDDVTVPKPPPAPEPAAAKTEAAAGPAAPKP
jgi:hypothetical protein